MKKTIKATVIISIVAAILLVVGTVLTFLNKADAVARQTLAINSIATAVLLVVLAVLAKKSNGGCACLLIPVVGLFVTTKFFATKASTVSQIDASVLTSGDVLILVVTALLFVSVYFATKKQKWAAITAAVIFALSIYALYPLLPAVFGNTDAAVKSLKALKDAHAAKAVIKASRDALLVQVGVLLTVVSFVLVEVAQLVAVLTNAKSECSCCKCECECETEALETKTEE